MRKQRHLIEDTKRQNIIIFRQVLLNTFLIVGIALLFDFMFAYFDQYEIDSESSILQDPFLIQFCENHSILDLEAFKINNLEIQRNAIKINGVSYGPMVCLAFDQARELIFKSLEADNFESAKGLFYSITHGRIIQEWFTKWHNNDRGASTARPWHVNLFVKDEEFDKYSNR